MFVLGKADKPKSKLVIARSSYLLAFFSGILESEDAMFYLGDEYEVLDIGTGAPVFAIGE